MAKKPSKYCNHSLEVWRFKSGRATKNYVCKLCGKKFRQVQ
jgi:hypothetical protein